MPEIALQDNKSRRDRPTRRLIASVISAAVVVVTLPAPSMAAESALPPQCSGTAPIRCHFDVAPGNYDVTVDLGSPTRAASTAMSVEARRQVLSTVATTAGQLVRTTSTVNVRTPEGQPTGQGGTGTPGLSITFDGSAPAIGSLTVKPATAPLVVYLAGDSTVCDQPTAPYTGWGQVLPTRVGSGAVIANYADSGESSGSFLSNSALFPRMKPLIKSKDLVFIQLGHNDKQTTATAFRDNLTKLVNGVRERGGTPVLMTPPVRRLFSGSRLTSTALHVNGRGVDLPAVIRALGRSANVPVIDLTAKSKALVESLGPTASQQLYLTREAGDNTHFSVYGATQMANLVVQGVRELNLSLTGYLRPTTAATDATTYFVAPNGSDSAAGTITSPWASIAHAQSVVQPGDTVFLRGGTYSYTRATRSCSSQTATVDAITLSKSGTANSPIRYAAYAGERPVFDFSRMTESCRIKGFDITGSWIHLEGLAVTGVRQNNNRNHESWGIWISGSNNTFERLDLHHNMGPGLFIQDGSNNLVLNSDSHDNYDPLSSTGPGTNADGFGAHVPAGRPGNVFRGDRAWWNADDGFDLINAFSPVTIENSWAWRSGYRPGTTTSSGGDGNGFKVGGYGGKYVSNGVKHTLRLSTAFLNRASGVYANHHTVANNYFGNTSYGNHPDFNMLGINSGGAAIGLGYLRNNLAYTGTLTSNMSGTNSAYNSWNLGVSLSDAQFQSVSTSGWDAPRQPDGSLPTLPYLRPAAGSTLIDKGTDVGLPYTGRAPDLGAFETSGRQARSTDATQLNAVQVVTDMGAGWNLGNSLEANSNGYPSETAWGNPTVTQALIDKVKAAGFKSIRIPVSYLRDIGAGPNYTINASWLNRVQQVVNYAHGRGLYVIINMHGDGYKSIPGSWLICDAANQTTIKAKYQKVWQQIASRFQSYDNRLILESMNEEFDGQYGRPTQPCYSNINAYNQIFVDTVRRAGGNNSSRWLLVPGWNTNIDYTVGNYGFKVPTDQYRSPTIPSAEQRIMISVHYYAPWDFAGETSGNITQWGRGAANPSRRSTWGQEDYLDSQLKQMHDKFVVRGYPVVVGEYGSIDKSSFDSSSNRYRADFARAISATAKKYGAVGVYWDNGVNGRYGFGLFSRGNTAVTQQGIINAIRSGSGT